MNFGIESNSIMKISFSELLQKYLISVGINKMYGVVGREDSDLTFNTLENFEFILTRHEMTAGVMATAISKFTQSPQICFGTLGPGITNYMTALATATLDRFPLILIVAQMETPFIIYNDMHQCLDNISIAKPLTKYAYEMKNAKELKSVLESAMKASMTYPFGPSVISIPIDILASEIEVNENKPLLLNKDAITPVTSTNQNLEESIKEVAKTIQASKNPLILIGDATTKTHGVVEKIRRLVNETNIPVVSTYTAKGVVEYDSKLNLGVLSSYTDSIVEQNVNSRVFDPIDTIIFIGYDLCERHPYIWSNKSVPKTFININSYSNNVYKGLNPKFNVISDLNNSISMLTNELKGYVNKQLPDMSEVNTKINQLLKDKKQYEDGMAHPQIMNCLNEHFNNDYILANDIGMHRQLSSLFFRNSTPNSYVTSEGLSSFGTGLSLGLGSKIANPDKEVVIIAGDGGFHSNNGDLETAVRLGLKVLIVILNSNSNALIERYQLKGRYKKINKKNTSFGKVDFSMLAQANGCKSGIANNIQEFNKLLAEYDKADGPFLIEVPIHYPSHYVNEYSSES